MIQIVIVAVVAAIAISLALVRPRTGVGFTWLGGLMMLWLGQRLFVADTGEAAGTWGGLLVVLVAFGLRVRAMSAARGAEAATQRTALIWQAVGTLSLVLWFLTTDTVTGALQLTDEALDRWTVSWQALMPIVMLAGAIPMLLVDQLLGAHPVAMPDGARGQAVGSGLALAFGLALVFPLNYLANQHDVDWDFSYFRVTKPGTATLALMTTLDEPVEVLLFYPPASDTKEKMLPYFEELSDKAEGKLTLQVLDQPMVPTLAKDLSIRDNGYVVLRKGESTQKFKIDAELKKAQRDLKKLDSTFQKHMLKLVRDKRVVYLLTGHGEASHRGTNPFTKLSEFKKLLLNQNYEVEDLGLEQGSAEQIPEDAALVIVAAPEKEILDAEVKAINAYLDGGGAVLVYADPALDPMTGILSHLGLAVTGAPILHQSKIVPIFGGLQDRLNLYSQRFGSHATTSTLSKYATRAPVLMPSVVGIVETGDVAAPGPAKRTPLIRSYEDSWEDVNGNFERDADEPLAVSVLAMAVEGPEDHPYKAMVIGDVSVASDIVLRQCQGCQVLAYDGVKWLVGDEDLSGEVSSEEDVKIEHTREDDVLWFYGTIFGVPLLVLIVGAVFVRRRRTPAAA